MSPVGVTGERESKRLSFLHLGSARRRRNGNPSRGGQDSYSGKGRSKKRKNRKPGKSQKPDAETWIGNPPSAKSGRRKSERSPKTGHRNREGTRKPSAENREKPESRTKEPGGNPKKGHATKSATKKGMPDKVSSASKNHPCRRLLRQG